jgi:hypothetical protein
LLTKAMRWLLRPIKRMFLTRLPVRDKKGCMTDK